MSTKNEELRPENIITVVDLVGDRIVPARKSFDKYSRNAALTIDRACHEIEVIANSKNVLHHFVDCKSRLSSCGPGFVTFNEFLTVLARVLLEEARNNNINETGKTVHTARLDELVPTIESIRLARVELFCRNEEFYHSFTKTVSIPIESQRKEICQPTPPETTSVACRCRGYIPKTEGYFSELLVLVDPIFPGTSRESSIYSALMFWECLCVVSNSLQQFSDSSSAVLRDPPWKVLDRVFFQALQEITVSVFPYSKTKFLFTQFSVQSIYVPTTTEAEKRDNSESFASADAENRTEVEEHSLELAEKENENRGRLKGNGLHLRWAGSESWILISDLSCVLTQLLMAAQRALQLSGHICQSLHPIEFEIIIEEELELKPNKQSRPTGQCCWWQALLELYRRRSDQNCDSCVGPNFITWKEFEGFLLFCGGIAHCQRRLLLTRLAGLVWSQVFTTAYRKVRRKNKY